MVSGSDEIDGNVERDILNNYPQSQFFYGSPQLEELRSMVREYDFWVFDDLSTELRKNSFFTNFFTKTCHHKNCIMA